MNKLQHSTKKAARAILRKKSGKLESYHLMIVGLFAGMGSVLFLSSKLLAPKLFIL